MYFLKVTILAVCLLVVSSYVLNEKEVKETDKAGSAPSNPAPAATATKENSKETAKLEAPKDSGKAEEKDTKTKQGVAKSEIETTTNESPEEPARENAEEGNEDSKEQGESSENSEESPAAAERESEEANDKDSAKEGSEGEEDAEAKADDGAEERSCNLKFKRVGCYKKKSNKPSFSQFIKTDDTVLSKKGKIIDANAFNEKLPKMVCDCANAAIDAGNAVFSLRNIAECWTGADDTKYDAEGVSNKCVTFDKQQCDESSEICAGKKHADFVYYIDSPEHTKSPEEVADELRAEKEKKAALRKKNRKNKNKKGGKGKGKKSNRH